MRASLPMYDRPELSAAHQAYWALIKSGLQSRGYNSVPDLSLDGVGLDFWQAPDLILSQTCGLPYRKWLHKTVRLVGTPDFGLDGCPPGYYNSAIVVRHDDKRASLEDFGGAVLALNGFDSQSGFGALHDHMAGNGPDFAENLITGAHRASAQAVANGTADIAALDAVSWRLMCRWDGFADQLRVLELTAPTPGLPYICAAAVDPGLVATAVSEAIAALPPDMAKLLGIKGLIDVSKDAYLAMPIPADAT